MRTFIDTWRPALRAEVADAGPELGRSALAPGRAAPRAQKRLLDHVSTVRDALVSGAAHAPGVAPACR